MCYTKFNAAQSFNYYCSCSRNLFSNRFAFPSWIFTGYKTKQGEVIATAVGFKNNVNVFVDFGVYDTRGKSKFQNPRDSAVCWFDLLPEEDAKIVKSLPSGSSESGTQSTLCKP